MIHFIVAMSIFITVIVLMSLVVAWMERDEPELPIVRYTPPRAPRITQWWSDDQDLPPVQVNRRKGDAE